MQYNKTDVDIVKQYKSKNMSNKTIVALINKQSEQKYTEEDIEKMLVQPAFERQKLPDNKLYDVAAGIVFNPEKRRKIKRIALIVLGVFLLILITLGALISWNIPLITIGIVLGLAIVIVSTFFILVKTGLMDKFMDSHGF